MNELSANKNVPVARICDFLLVLKKFGNGDMVLADCSNI